MEIEMVHPRHVYASGEFPPDAKVPYILKFDFEDLDQNYVITPLDKLFRSVIDKLNVPFLHAEITLFRHNQNTLLPATLNFMAQDKASSNSVKYSRILTQGAASFDDLDKGKITLAQLINNIIKCPPVGGEAKISLKDFSLSLKDGFDYGKYIVNDIRSYGDGHIYNNSERKLTIQLNLPWLNKSLPGSKIEHDLAKSSLEEAVQFAERILADYLQTL